MSIASKLAILCLVFSLSLIVFLQLRMPRKVGTRYIEDRRVREITFYKRRHGLFKGAADLSTLTGANIAIVLESRDSGKLHSFGTPSVEPIVDRFLSGNPPMGSFPDEGQKSRIELLQGEVNRLENQIAMFEKRNKLLIQHANEVEEESSRTTTKQDLNIEQLNMHFSELMHIEQDTSVRLPALNHGKESEVSTSVLTMSQNVLQQGNSSSMLSLEDDMDSSSGNVGLVGSGLLDAMIGLSSSRENGSIADGFLRS